MSAASALLGDMDETMAGAEPAAWRFVRKREHGSAAVSYATGSSFVCLWLGKHAESPGSVRIATGLSYTTIHRWYARFRQHLPSDGGELLSGVVAVDEAWFGKQRHSKRGKQTIVMGGIEVDTRRLRLQVIPDTEQDSIELFLEVWVARGSHLITDAHASYNGVEWLDYSREAYNHSTGHFGMSSHIECIWSAMKRHLRKLYGCRSNPPSSPIPPRMGG